MQRFARLVSIVILLFGAVILTPGAARGQGNIPLERDRMKDILSVVSKEIEKNYFDPQLKGLDWKGLTAQAKEKIEKAGTVSDMVTAIFALVDKLQDSHTIFQLIREEQAEIGDDDKYHYAQHPDGIGYVEFRGFPNSTEFLDGLVGK